MGGGTRLRRRHLGALQPCERLQQATDVSAKYPQKLKELQDAFWVEAKKYDVLPLDDRFSERGDRQPAAEPDRGTHRFHLLRRDPDPRALGRQHQERIAHDHRHHRSASGRRRRSPRG
jgi:hypothetical protein